MLTFDHGQIAILDAGSGLRYLGKDLLASGHVQRGTTFIAFSHFHWDHIQGFPFFAPAYDPKRHFTISAFGRGRQIKDLKSIFEVQMQHEYFPVGLDQMGATFAFLQPEVDVFRHEEAIVTSQRHHHPGGAYTYRIEHGGKVVVFCTDVEHLDGIDPKIIAIARKADLLIHDAQYTPDELKTKRGWGHSSWEQAIAVAERAGVQRLVLTHHDPDHNDAFLAEVEQECQKRFPACLLARERTEIEI
jgi:phosphoribosyl 1,2-cyclic phosphodiesterase